jgi:hypothetical protein
MSDAQRLLKAEDIVRKLNEQAVRAIALRAMWARCADKEDVLYAMRPDHLTPGFRIVRDSLHIDLILTLMRLHERAPQEPASIPAVVEILSDPNIQRALGEVGRRDAARECLELFDELPRDVLRRLRQLRDRVLAHNDRRGLEMEPTVGDETLLLNKSLAIVSAMDLAIRGNGSFLSEPQQFWDALADGFWEHVAVTRS